jgi:phage terminase large subunit-like protein
MDITDYIDTLVKGDKQTKLYFLDKLKTTPFLTYKPINETTKRFHSSTARIKGLFGGNRSGKTTAGAQEVIWWATGTHPYRQLPKPPVDIWVVSLDFPSSRDITQPIILKLLGQRYLLNWHETDKIVELTNGSTIGFKSVDSGWEKFQGTRKHLIWFDEEPAWSVYQECRMRIVDTLGTILITETPLHGMTWVYDDIYEVWENKEDPDIECFIMSTYENPYIDRNELDKLEKSYFDEEKEARLKGNFVEFAGLVYKEFNRQIHLIKRFPIPKDWTRLIGIDPGINNPTAAVFWAISPDGVHYIYDEYYVMDTNVEGNARNLKARIGLDEISCTFIDPSACNRNPAHPELKSLRDEYARFGIYTKPANNDVLFGVNKVKALLSVNDKTKKPSLYIFDDCLTVLKELTRYRWDTYKYHEEEKNPKEHPKKVMDHCMDALRYIAASDPIYTGDYRDIDIRGEKSSRKWTKYG